MSQAIIDNSELTSKQFSFISDMVKDMCGINLHSGKKTLVRARLTKRLRTLGLDNFGEYIERVQNDTDGCETLRMLDALSTNLTHFFRENRHFDALRERVLPAMLDRHHEDGKLRIWSAGCSSGEEPYSIAMTLKENLGDLDDWDVGILATDLSTRMLRIANQGAYGQDRLDGMSRTRVSKHFVPDSSDPKRPFRIAPDLRKMVSFARLNLMDPWPMKGKFDAIFCRNVMIYFDKPTQAKLIERFWDQLAPGGVLFIGHSESLAGIRHKFRYLLPTVYEKH